MKHFFLGLLCLFKFSYAHNQTIDYAKDLGGFVSNLRSTLILNQFCNLSSDGSTSECGKISTTVIVNLDAAGDGFVQFVNDKLNLRMKVRKAIKEPDGINFTLETERKEKCFVLFSLDKYDKVLVIWVKPEKMDHGFAILNDKTLFK